MILVWCHFVNKTICLTFKYSLQTSVAVQFQNQARIQKLGKDKLGIDHFKQKKYIQFKCLYCLFQGHLS